ncbi:MAG: gliding motility-associated C-terminal domain-containing protein [Bacteroidota bacterium]
MNSFYKPHYLVTLFAFALYFFPVQGISQSNEGNDFWFGFMEHIDPNVNEKVVMITSKFNTSGTVSAPLLNWSQPFTVTANSVTIIDLPANTENLGSESISNKGIRLTSAQPVSVYIHQYHSFRSEASVVLPVNSIGKEYYCMSYEGVTRQGVNHPSEFLIVGVNDETTINITVSDQTQGGTSPGSTISILLDEGETYQVQAFNGNGGDLTGSSITGDKDFAVFSGNSWTEVPTGCGARDNLLEQMYPVATWGKQFITVPNASVSFDVFRILASEDDTEVEVNSGTVQTFNLDAGQFAEYQLSDPAFITSNNSILIAQFTVGSFCSGHVYGDPSMVILNSIEQTRDTVTLFNSGFENIFENYIKIIMASNDFPFVSFDGQPLSDLSAPTPIGTNGEFSFVQLAVSQGAHTIVSEGCGIIASAYGYGDVESYAYSGGASFNTINANPIPEGGCLNDTLSFDAGLPPNRYSFEWDLGDGTFSSLPAFDHFYENLGSYPVELIITDNCLGTIDTVNRDLLITLRQALDAVPDIDICEGNSFSLGATDVTGARYEWTGPNDYFSEQQLPQIQNAAPSDSGEYAVVGIVSGCATFPSITEVVVHDNPEPYLGEDTLFCGRDEPFVLTPGEYAGYRWQNNSGNSSFETQEEGTFSVEVTDIFGCMGTDSITLIEICPTLVYIPNAFTPNYDGINDTFGVYGQDIINLNFTVWSRWGELLFQSTSLDSQWDGFVNNKLAPPGVYIWMLELEGYREDGTQFSEVQGGSVTLIR